MRWFYAVALLLSLFGTSLLSQPAIAGWDASVLSQGRTYSPALAVSPTVGYGFLVWGEREADPKTPWYGFIRPYATGLISPSVMEGKLGIQIFPISILGVDLRRVFGRRFYDTRGQDCTQVQCQGELNSTDLSVQSFLGYASYFSSIRWTHTTFDAISDRTRPIYEIGSSILLSPNGDEGDFLTVILGKRVNTTEAPEKSFGILLQSAWFKQRAHSQDGQYAIYRVSLETCGWKDATLTLGLGRHRSSLDIAEVSAIFQLQYNIEPAIGF